MFFCRHCQSDFDVISRKPMVLPCGHTFCHLCIAESFAAEGRFECKNCTFVAQDFGQVFQNLILTDKHSMRQSSAAQAPRDPRPQSFFDSSGPPCKSTFAESQFRHMQSAWQERGMVIEGQSRQDLCQSFGALSLSGLLNSSDTLRKSGESSRGRGGLQRLVAHEALGPALVPSPVHSPGLTANRNKYVSLPKSSTPTKPKPFGIPDSFCIAKALTAHKQTATLERPKFGSSAFGRYNNHRCSRVGCFNNRHKGFGEEFWYCSVNCFEFAEGRKWQQERGGVELL